MHKNDGQYQEKNRSEITWGRSRRYCAGRGPFCYGILLQQMITDAQEGTTVTLTQVYTGRAGDATASPRCACASLLSRAVRERRDCVSAVRVRFPAVFSGERAAAPESEKNHCKWGN